MKREHMPFKYMSNWKAFAIDYAFYLSLSDEPVSVCLTPRQMYVLSVQNSYTYWLTRWYNTEDIDQSVVALIAAEIEDLLMCGCGVQEPSITDRFNTNNYISDTSTVYSDTYNTWNTAGQTIASIAPNLDLSSGDPVNIDKLFCLAFRMLVVALTQTGASQANQSAAGKRDMIKAIGAAMTGLASAGGIAAAVGGTAAELLAVIGGPVTLLGLAIGGVAVGISSLFVQADNAAMNDADAVERVACTMYVNTSGVDMTQAAFAGALTPNAFVSGSNEAKIAAIVGPFLADLTVYIEFLSIMDQLYGALDFGSMADCPCELPRHAVESGSSFFDTEVFTFIERDGDYDVWSVTTVDCPMTIVMDNGQQYTHGYNVKFVSGAAFDIDDDIPLGNSVWALWLDAASALLNARHFPNTSGPGQMVAQGHVTANTTCRFKIKPH